MNQLTAVITKLYEKEVGLNKEISSKLSSMFTKIAEANGEHLDPLSKLQAHFLEWFKTVEKVQILLKRYDEDRLVYDHYKGKVDQLRIEHEKTGKVQDQLTRVRRHLNARTKTSSTALPRALRRSRWRSSRICKTSVTTVSKWSTAPSRASSITNYPFQKLN